MEGEGQLQPRPLHPPDKNAGTNWKEGLGGPRSRYGHFGEDKNLLPLHRYKTGLSISKLFTLLTCPACLRELLVILIYTALFVCLFIRYLTTLSLTYR